MCEAVGHPVRRLHRSAYAGLTVVGLAPGEWYALDAKEVERLRSLAGTGPAARGGGPHRPKPR
jgi:23S rRNA pseudouridine2605 synthase